MKSIGYPYKKGQIVRIEGVIYEVAKDVEWWSDFQIWGSVWLVGQYPPIFTHKGNIELLRGEADEL